MKLNESRSSFNFISVAPYAPLHMSLRLLTAQFAEFGTFVEDKLMFAVTP